MIKSAEEIGMTVIFLFPLVLSVFSAIYLCTEDVNWLWKIFSVLFVGASVAFQFLPTMIEEVHFLIPLVMQLTMCACFWFYQQLQ